MIEAYQFFLVPSWSSSTPLYPKVQGAKEQPPIPCSFVIFSLELTFESLKELGARQNGLLTSIKICSISDLDSNSLLILLEFSMVTHVVLPPANDYGTYPTILYCSCKM
jgi:hypothetical protein